MVLSRSEKEILNNSIFKADVAVIGAGPAGTATALSLINQGLSVSLIERSGFDSRKIGEHLTPDAFETLEQLGVLDRVRSDQHLEPPVFQSIWGSDELVTVDYFCNPLGGGLTLNRPRFDESLVDKFKSCGGSFYPWCRVRKIESGYDDWRLTLQFSESKQLLDAKFLVDATGRCAWLARKMGQRPIRFDKLVALAVLMPAKKSDFSGALLESLPEGWWYTSLLPESELVAIFVTDGDLARKSKKTRIDYWYQMLSKSRTTQERIGSRNVHSVRVLPAMSHFLAQPFGNAWLSVGTAAMATDPLSSSGIANGLRDGVKAAMIINDYLNGNHGSLEDYKKALKQCFESYLDDRLKYYSSEARWPQSIFWMRRHSRGIAIEDNNGGINHRTNS